MWEGEKIEPEKFPKHSDLKKNRYKKKKKFFLHLSEEFFFNI